jgi:hypothetical protein
MGDLALVCRGQLFPALKPRQWSKRLAGRVAGGEYFGGVAARQWLAFARPRLR